MRARMTPFVILGIGAATIAAASCSSPPDVAQAQPTQTEQPASAASALVRQIITSVGPALRSDGETGLNELRSGSQTYLDRLAKTNVDPALCKAALTGPPKALVSSTDAASITGTIGDGGGINVTVYKAGQEAVQAVQTLGTSCGSVDTTVDGESTTQLISALPATAYPQLDDSCRKGAYFYRIVTRTPAGSDQTGVLPSLRVSYGLIISAKGYAYEMRSGKNEGLEPDPKAFASNARSVLDVACKQAA